MSRHPNKGKVDLEMAAADIIANGRTKKTERKNGYTHHIVYLKNKGHDRHLSWDEYDDGTIKNVHTTDDRGAAYTYGN